MRRLNDSGANVSASSAADVRCPRRVAECCHEGFTAPVFACLAPQAPADEPCFHGTVQGRNTSARIVPPTMR